MPYPKISIVTPSFNQGQFLEATLRSVLDQDYPNLEYIVIDGGSTDNSVEIIRRCAPRLAYWVSEPDRGQNHAITKGFQHASGEIYAYLNSDDTYFPWTLRTVARIFEDLPEVQWLTTQTNIELSEAGDLVIAIYAAPHARTWFYRGLTLGNEGRYKSFIQQEATFWRRSLWEAAGARMDESLYMAGDFELWARFYQHADLVTTRCPLAGWRRHGSNKTIDDRYYDVAQKILAPYRRQVIQNRAVLWLLRRALKMLKRGTRHVGSKISWVTFDTRAERWQLTSSYVL